MAVDVSIAELESISALAARGAGLHWGLSQDAGRAVGWLCARGYPGAALLAGLLIQNDCADYAEIGPRDETGVWQAPSGQLCPLVAGAAVTDRAHALAEGRSIEMGAIAYPLLLLPAAIGATRLTSTDLIVSWEGAEAHLSGEGHTLRADDLRRRSSSFATVALPHEAEPTPADCPRWRADIEAANWETLHDLARRTYAPSTASSRAGAGTQKSDRD